MKFIKIVEDCRTPYGAFHKGEVRKVEDEVAGMLLNNGWGVNGEPANTKAQAKGEPSPATLEVENVKLGVKAEVSK